MLKFISIKNLAVISKLNFELHPGLNLLTGETGAGKSIIIDALGLLLGERGGSDLIRTGEKRAEVAGIFELGGAEQREVEALLEGVGIEFENEGELIIRRELNATGRTRIFVNDRSVSAATLRELQPFLVEILGQGEQYTLVASNEHLRLLDQFARCEALRAKTSEAYAELTRQMEKLRVLKAEESKREREVDFLKFQLNELEKLNVRANEDAELNDELKLLVHAEKIHELCSKSYSTLYEQDESVLSGLSAVRKNLQELQAFDARAANWVESLESAMVTLSDVAEGLRSGTVAVEFSPEKIAEIENRLAELDRLKRKYNTDLAGLLQLKDEMAGRLELYETSHEQEEELKRLIGEARKEYVALAQRLTKIRKKAAGTLEKRVTEDLGRLAMERARFTVSLRTGSLEELDRYVESGAERGAKGASVWTSDGADAVEFFLTANLGESERPLSKVASGGELSRLMLTLHNICKNSAGSEDGTESSLSLVFDEIDAGIGGRTAEVVGQRLKGLASRQQVLCVTHQAQIARFADHHFVVSKHVEQGRTVTDIREVSGQERVGELARMISGTEQAETARETARWMLEGRGKA